MTQDASLNYVIGCALPPAALTQLYTRVDPGFGFNYASFARSNFLANSTVSWSGTSFYPFSPFPQLLTATTGTVSRTITVN